MSPARPTRLALTPGEPAGVGPELVARVCMRAWPAQLVAIADPALLKDAAARLGLDLSTVPFDADAPRLPHRAGILPVLAEPLRRAVRPGHLDAANAAYVLATLDRAVAGCRNGLFDGIVTGPVHKGIINAAGIPFSGHTEYLAARVGNPPVVMLLAAPGLRVALATTHLPLAAVPAAITRQGLDRTLRVLLAALRDRFRLATPRITVLGLNPHAGESGHLGREEIECIAPVVEALRREGHALTGPVPADTAFSPEGMAASDAFLAMYHDQGLPVLKHLGFGRAVNITLGLPFLRTSVDHGTALALAGSGRADAGSLEAAIDLALHLRVEGPGTDAGPRHPHPAPS